MTTEFKELTVKRIKEGQSTDGKRVQQFQERVGDGIRYATHADIKATRFEVIDVFYNRKRQHSTLGYTSPIQSMENWLS